jgi:hypothetical protein
MDQEFARYLLTGAHAFLSDKNLSTWEGIDRENFFYLLNSLLGTTDTNTAVSLLEKIVTEELTAPSLPPDLTDLVKEWQKAKDQKEEIRQEASQKVVRFLERQRKAYLPLAQAAKEHFKEKEEEPFEKKWKNTEKTLKNKVETELLRFDPALASDPELCQQMTKDIGEILISQSLQEGKELDLWPAVNKILTDHGYVLKLEKQRNFYRDLKAQTEKEIEFFQKEIEFSLPPSLLQNYSQTNENVAFPVIYALANPRVLVAYGQKAALALPVKFLQAGAEEANPEWQAMLEKGVFAQNFDLTIEKLKKAGLEENHPLIKKLEAEKNRFLEAERTASGKEKLAVKLLKGYYQFEELTGQKKAVSRDTGLALSSNTLWQKQSGWAFNLKNLFNRIGLASKIYQKFPALSGKTVVSPRFSIGAIAWTNRKLWRPLYLAVAKTAAGKTIKAGIKKFSAWVATKLGIQTAVAAAGISTGPAIIVAAAIDLGIEVIGFVWNKAIKPLVLKVSQWIKEPDKAFTALLVGAGIIVAFPSFAALGVVLAGLGALGLIGSAGSIITGFALGTTSFFTALVSGSFAAVPITAFVLAILGTLASLTFFIVMTTAGAFILPVIPKGAEAGPMPTVTPNPTGVHLAEQIVYRLGECQITRVNISTWEETKKCLEESGLPNKQIIINNFKASVESNKSLQCVGFVAGVEQALGRAFPQDRNAREYLERVPSGYQKISGSEVRIGDLAVWQGTRYGHIAVVVRKEGNVKIVVAQAWGDDAGLDGRVNLTETTIDNPSGFLRPI